MKSTKHSWMTRLWGKRDKAITGKHSRMRRVGRYSLIVILVVVVVGGIWIGGILNPEHRFNKAILNPLTIPSSNVVTDNEAMVQSLSTPAPKLKRMSLPLQRLHRLQLRRYPQQIRKAHPLM